MHWLGHEMLHLKYKITLYFQWSLKILKKAAIAGTSQFKISACCFLKLSDQSKSVQTIAVGILCFLLVECVALSGFLRLKL
jgi:hypothetical protein